MDKANALPTPMISNSNLSKNHGEQSTNIKQYRSTVGALQYITISRPEISYSVNKVFWFMQNPLDEHWKTVKRILRYLRGTLDYILTLKACNNTNIVGYADSNWATDLYDRKSQVVTAYI